MAFFSKSTTPAPAPPEEPSADLPAHVAIIMDGNGRWARQRHLPRIAGHRAGVEAVRAIVEACAARGVRVLTLFAFSSENWRRPESEVNLLMDLLLTSLQREVDRLHRNGIRLLFIGERAVFNAKLIEMMDTAERLTAANAGLTLVIALNYGGRWDVTQAAQQLARRVEAGEIRADEIDAAMIEGHLCLRGLPEPDLFIRTGGEQRISNFLLWHLSYTELYFTAILWPDFDARAFDDALTSFAARQRRFGRTGDQVEQAKGA
ncbi:MAG: isoprenyl transferase [Gammaproteobacteria bacterium]|nr:isoprenyl transferase [Gammaproteobacteria bacterium]